MISIREPIGHHWRDELIWLAAPHLGPLLGEAGVVNAHTGHSLPCQLVHDTWEEGANGHRRMCVRIDLEPDAEIALDFSPERNGDTRNPFSMHLTTMDGIACWEINNGRTHIRVPASQDFDAGTTHGPIMAVRREENSLWHGRGLWGASEFLGRIETEIIDKGPLYARWIVRYIVGGKQLALYEMRLVAGEDFVHVRDETCLGAGAMFCFRLEGEQCPTDWYTRGGGEMAGAHARLRDAPMRIGPDRPGELLHIDFHSGHFQMSYTWAGFWRQDGPIVGICEFNGGKWAWPGRNRIRVMQEADALEMRFPCDGGGKEFAFVCGAKDEYAPAEAQSRFCAIRRKYSDIPLEKVRHWTVDAALESTHQLRLYPDWAARRAFDEEAWPELRAAFLSLTQPWRVKARYYGDFLPSYVVSGDAEIYREIVNLIDHGLANALAHVFDDGYLALIIFDGRILKVALEAIDVLRARGELDQSQLRHFARRFAFIAHCMADDNFWPWDAVFRERLDPRGHGDDYWQDIGGSICPPNFLTEYYSTFLLTGLCFPEYSCASAWVDKGVELFARNLQGAFFDSGGYCESANYTDHAVGIMVQLGVALLAAGRRDFFAHPRFKGTFAYLLDMLAPPVAATEGAYQLATSPMHMNPPAAHDDRVVLLHNWGNSGTSCGGNVVPQWLAIAAGIYGARDYPGRDEAYAARLMTAWRASPQQFFTGYFGFGLLALGLPDLPEVDLDLGSTIVEGLGAAMRAGQGTDEAIFAWVKAGLATNHNCRDEGGLVLYAYGAPLIGDFGYHTQHEGRQEGGAETWKHACVSFGGKTSSAYLGTDSALPPELWRSTPNADLLVCYAPVEYISRDGQDYRAPTAVPRIEHRRFIVFLKPHCFVIYDSIPQSGLPSTWWLHALSDEIEVSDNTALLRGRYGVDLHASVLLPEAPQICQGKYSVQRHIYVEQPCAGDYLAVVTPLRRDAPAPVAHFDSDQHLLTIEGQWGTSRLFIAPLARDARIGGANFRGRIAIQGETGWQALDGRFAER